MENPSVVGSRLQQQPSPPLLLLFLEVNMRNFTPELPPSCLRRCRVTTPDNWSFSNSQLY